VVLIAFNLRPVFSSLSVVLPEIIKATGLSATAASLLTTLPIVCLGVFAPLAPGLGRRFGTERTLLGCMVLIGVGTVLRGTGHIPLLFLASAIAGSGIAVSNVLLSGLVKRDFASQAALMMGLYTMAVCGGAASAAGFTVPLEHALGGGWTMALAMWALPAALVTLIWAPQALPRKPVASESGFTVRGLWRDKLAWQVTFFMGLQSALAYIVMGWLAPILRERGLGSETAGYVVSLSVMTQVVTCLVVPALAVKLRNQRGLAVVLAAMTVAAMLAMLFAPLAGVWAWAVLLGIAQGGTFALALTMIVLRSPRLARGRAPLGHGAGRGLHGGGLRPAGGRAAARLDRELRRLVVAVHRPGHRAGGRGPGRRPHDACGHDDGAPSLGRGHQRRSPTAGSSRPAAPSRPRRSAGCCR
jgi:CP family cyanate transporter-like MFS transporter